MNKKLNILVKGAGVAGVVTAMELCERGAHVTLYEIGHKVGSGASWMAGGMLAPWCEAESAPREVTRDSIESLQWWKTHVPSVKSTGTLVIAPPRDVGEIKDFSRRTSHYKEVTAEQIAKLEPDLAGRFAKGLFFEEEGVVDPRQALLSLAQDFQKKNGQIVFGKDVDSIKNQKFDWEVDCTGLHAQKEMKDLRGVRGEMMIVRTAEVTLHRPIRVLHPRIPIYIVPRSEHRFMIGATMIESENDCEMTVKSALELLSTLWIVNPAFSEAEILEMNAGLRPSYPDNVPRVRKNGRKLSLNGMYRHGFLLSPCRAKEVAHIIFDQER